MTIFIIIHVFGGVSEQPHIFIGEEKRGEAQAKFDELAKEIRPAYDSLAFWKCEAHKDKYTLIESI